MTTLTSDQIQTRLASLPNWNVKNSVLTHTFTLQDFAHGVLLIGAIGQLAEAANHHPDLRLHDYKMLTIELSTHSEGGLTEKDFDLAVQIQGLPQKPAK
jgi:4a-hydroxytetrahydrobiopterin dehydratase